jgi:hypothetical protein
MVIPKHLFVEFCEASIGGTPPVSDTSRIVRRKEILRPLAKKWTTTLSERYLLGKVLMSVPSKQLVNEVPAWQLY